MDLPESLSVCHNEGFAAWLHSHRAANPYFRHKMSAWAWDLGWRLSEFLAAEKRKKK